MSLFDVGGMALLSLVVLAGAVLVVLVTRAARRIARRRRREALHDHGLQLAFDACAPEGGDLSLAPFHVGRLRDGIDGIDPRRG
jgi:hypothetical protein